MTIQNSGNSTSLPITNTGYFNVKEYGNPPQDVMAVVNQVLSDLSSIIKEKHGSTDCGLIPFQKVALQLAWLNFSDPNPTIFAQLQLNDPLNSNAAGIGSPFYSNPLDNICDEVVYERPFIKINGGKPDLFSTIYDGRILLNSNLPGTSSCQQLTWNSNPNSTNFPCQIDLYTVVLHELLHVLGFGSRIGLGQAYSNWDQILRIVSDYIPGGGGSNPIRAIVNPSGFVSNCWDLTPNFTNTALNSCSNSIVGEDVVLGDAAIAAIEGNPNISAGSPAFPNMLSHLSQSCNGQNIPYVMTASLAANEYKREITEPEKKILCELGYEVNSPNFDCLGCSNIANSDFPLDNDYACCYKVFYACPGQTITIKASELLCNDVTSGSFQEITRLFSKFSNWLPNSSIVPNSNQTEWSITIPTNINYIFPYGNIDMLYTVKGCDNKLYNGDFNIVVDGECVNCVFTADLCDNMICNGNFEDFHSTQRIETYFGWPIIFQGQNQIGSPDILATNTGNHYLRFGSNNSSKEAISLELQNCLKPNCDLLVNLDISAQYLPNSVEIWGSKTRPCQILTPMVSPINKNCGNQTSCDVNSMFDPHCLFEIEAINNWMGNNSPNFESSGNLIWHNTTSDEICYLNFSPKLGTTSDNLIFLDNIIVQQKCEPSITITPTIPIKACTGQNVELQFKICAGDVETKVIPNLLLPMGWALSNASMQPFMLTANQCTTLKLIVNIPFDSQIGISAPITFSGTIEGVCSSKTFSNTYSIIVNRCFSCDCPNGLNIDVSENNPLYNANLGGVRYSALEAVEDYDKNDDGIIDETENHGCIAILGKLIVDQNLAIEETEMKMQPGSAIEIKRVGIPISNYNSPKLRLEENKIHGCEAMWKGIIVQNNCSLIMVENLVKDAEFAVTASGDSDDPLAFFMPSTSLDIQDNSFIKNHVGLNFKSTGSSFFSNVSQVILNNGFTSVENGFIGGFPVNNTLLPSYTSNLANYNKNIGYAGIISKNVSLLIGTPTGTGNSNAVVSMRNGIIADNCSIDVFRSHFQDIYNYGGSQTTWPFENTLLPSLSNSHSIAILALNGRAKIVKNTFKLCGHAVYGIQNTWGLDVQKNSIKDVNVGVETYQPSNFNIFRNENMTFSRRAITASNLMSGIYTGYTIGRNTGSVSLGSFGGGGAVSSSVQPCVNINNINANVQTGIARISANEFTIKPYFSGFRLQGLGGWKIDDNSVFLNQSSTSSFGFSLENSNNNDFYENHVTFGSPSQTIDNIGYDLISSTSNKFCCNTALNTFIGHKFTLLCDNTDLRHSDMDGHFFQLIVSNKQFAALNLIKGICLILNLGLPFMREV